MVTKQNKNIDMKNNAASENTYKIIEYDLEMESDKFFNLLEESIGDDILEKVRKFGNPFATGLSLLTGSAGIERIMKLDNVHPDPSIKKRVIIESDQEYRVDISHIQMLDSSLVDSRSNKGYPLSSYTIIILWADTVVAILRPKHSK